MNNDDQRLNIPLPELTRPPAGPHLLDGLQPVSPAPSVPALTARLLLLTSLLLAFGALTLGVKGVRAMTSIQLALYAVTVAAGAAAFAHLSATESSPAALRRLRPSLVSIAFFAVLAAGFTPLFPWHPESGIPMRTCIVLTFCCSAFSIAAAWLLVRRGFFVRPAAAGLAASALAASTGFSIVQTLCRYMEASHILSSHVLPAAAFAYLGAAALAAFLQRKNSP